jgi:Fuc2NAc and GlcNAc transferase
MTLSAVVALLVASALSWCGTRSVLGFLRARSVLDVPNERSSHSTPTPRGGGLAFVAVILAGILIGVAAGWVRGAVAIALVPSAGAIGLVGWIDDRRGLPAQFRLLVHLVAAVWVVYCFGPAASLELGPLSLSLGPAAGIVSVLGLVWLSNLFNFMDGIDGIAGGEAASVAVVAALLCLRAGDAEPAWLFLLVAAAVAGFLPWNWAPARVFMGDTGSVVLGFLLGALALLANQRDDIPALGSALLLGVFLLDATLTLVRRIVRRERWTAAHRSHAYQRAAQAGESHARVSGAVIAINVLLGGLVWAGLAWRGWTPGFYGVGLLFLLALYLRIERLRPM